MNKHGFTILELLIAIAISSMIAMVLFNGFFIVNKTVKVADERMVIESRTAQMQHYIDRDLSGATTVIQPEEKPEPKQQPGKQAEPKAEEKESEQATKKAKPIEKVFVCTKQGGRLDSLTFITNNPLPKFWGAKDITLTPNIARVTYQVKEDPAISGAYLLERQETSNISSDKADAVASRPYTMVEGIRELTVKFLAKFEEDEEQKKEDQAATPGQQAAKPQPQQSMKKKKKISYKEVDEWNTDNLIKDQKAREKEKQKGPQQQLIPVRVTMQGSFWDNAKKRSFPFKFNVSMPTDSVFKPKPKPAAVPFAPQPQPMVPGNFVASAKSAPPSQQSVLSNTIGFLNKMLGPMPPAMPGPNSVMGMQMPVSPMTMPGTMMPGMYTPIQGRS